MNQSELRATVEKFLNKHHKAVFSILDEKGLPTTSLMLYAVDDELNIYFGTRKAFSKYDCLKTNTVVSLSVVQEGNDPLQVVDIRGQVSEVPLTEMVRVHTYFKGKNPAKYYVEGTEDFVMFKLKPDFMRWVDASSGELSIVDLNI